MNHPVPWGQDRMELCPLGDASPSLGLEEVQAQHPINYYYYYPFFVCLGFFYTNYKNSLAIVK